MTRVLMVIAGPDEGKSFQLAKEQSVSVGRGAASDFQINDPFISRVHFYVKAQGEQTILNDAGSKGGLAVNGQTVAEHELEIGDVIYLGETHIRYQSSDSPIDAQFGSTFSERVFQPNELTTYGFGDANVRLENLSILPHMISESRSDKDLAAGLVKLLLESIPNANVVSVAEYESTQRKSDSTLAFEKPKMMQSGSRDGSSVRPSRRLVDRALRDGESVLHVWSEMAAESLYTQSGQEDWAFCTPIPGDACEGWFLYVAGKLPFQSESAVTSKQLLGNLRFTELVAQFIGAIRQVRVLQDQQSIMRQFFSPRVVDTFSGPQTEDVLRPQEGTVSVLFCDVRGFSQERGC